ncbi:glycosyltransferase family 39 protein [uncultured Rhodoblastus sp.]|uniref:ArnT family glycosyltransferase n=1 Tax=uncultured Rhodoblastus sp. TaxID=543037 RepID=UPI0025CE7B51|nr:glycosyltransferase family 39 protein [uncultured Rhodoblastus sp.]
MSQNPRGLDTAHSGWASGLDQATYPTKQPETFLDRYAGGFVALSAALLCVPFMRAFLGQTDEGIWLHAAMRMNSGQVLYRDFFEFHPPLGFLIVSGWTAVFGPSLLAARILHMLVIAATAWLAYACCRILSGRPVLSACLALTWVASSQGIWTLVNHHWFTSFFSLLSLWAIMTAEAKPARLALAGLAASAAMLVTTHRGALVVVAGFVSLLPGRSVKALALYAAGGASLLFAVLGFLWLQGSLRPAFDEVIVWASQSYSQIQNLPYGAFPDRQTWFPIVAFPLIALLMGVALYREGFALLRRPHWGAAVLFALAGFLGCFPRPMSFKIAWCVVLALPLLSGLVAVLLKDGLWSRLAVGALALAAVAWPLKQLVNIAGQAARAQTVETHAGRVAMLQQNGLPELIRRLEALPPHDSVFVYPYDPLLPVWTGRSHPASYDILIPQYSTPSQYDQTCREVMSRAQWVVFNPSINSREFYHMIYPAMTDSSPPEKAAFEAALYKGFDLEGNYGVFQLLRRGKADVSLCEPSRPAR